MPAFSFAVSDSRNGIARIVSIEGELDLATTDELAGELERALSEADDVVVDLSRVRFIDSTGLRALLATHRSAGEHGRRVSVVCPGGVVRRAFELTLLTDLLVIHEELPAALRWHAAAANGH